MLNILPAEILLAVADLVDPQSLRAMSRVSRRLRSISIPLLYEAIEFRAPSEWALNLTDIDAFCQLHPTSRDRCYLQHTRHLCISAPIVFARFNRCAYFNIFRLSTDGRTSSSLGTSNETKAHAQFLDDLARQLQMLQLQLKQDRLHSFQWHLGTCIPPGFLDSGGYIHKDQSSLKRLSLITDGSCPHAGQCLGGLCGLLNLRSLEWDGIRQVSELEILRACISRNRLHLIDLSIGFIAPIEAMNFYTDVLGVPLNNTEAGGSIGSTAIQYPSLLKLALSKVLLPQATLRNTMPEFTSLRSLTLRYCPNSLEFLSSFTSTQAPPHLSHFEFSYESFTVNEIEHGVHPLVTFLLLLNGLRHLYLKLSNFSNSFHVSRAISKHRPTLESFAYHERNLSAIDNEGLFEEVRDQTPAWLCKLPGIDHPNFAMALSICMEPSILQSLLQQNPRKSNLRVLHLRFSGSERAHRNIRNEILTQLCRMHKSQPVESSADNILRSQFCCTNASESSISQINPLLHSLDEGLNGIHSCSQRDSKMSEAEKYSRLINWAFGPFGLPSLRILAIGDFSFEGRYHNQQLLLHRNNGTCADINKNHRFCEVDVNQISVRDAILVNDSNFLSVCPENGLMDSPYE